MSTSQTASTASSRCSSRHFAARFRVWRSRRDLLGRKDVRCETGRVPCEARTRRRTRPRGTRCVAARPALFRSFTRELPALGKSGAERQRAITEGFADTLVALAEAGSRKQGPDAPGPLSRDAAIIIVGGLRELTVSALEQRRDVDELRASASQIVKAIIAGVP